MVRKLKRPERAVASPRLQSFCERYGVPDPESAMRVACRTLIAECGVSAPPVPLRALSNHLGVHIVRRATPGAATLRTKQGVLEVWVGADTTKWRRERFTLAHELAHVLLLSGSSSRLGPDLSGEMDSLEHEEHERLCNLGAAEILMPKKFLLDRIATVGLSSTGLQALYDCFLVSFETLLYRLAEILPSSAVILWRRYARHGAEPVALRVLTSYQRYQTSLNAPWLPKGTTARKHVNPDIVTLAFEGRSAVFSQDLTLELDKREEHCLGLATVLPQPRQSQSQMPLFEGKRILDEASLEIHAVLLVGKRSMHSNPILWKTIEELTQC
jgi:IrrE N-terminal-like domain